jgi:HK97 family phage major capsid protein
MTEVMEAQFAPPGNWRSALYRKDAPGAALDTQEWAKSWPAYLAAVLDKHDPSARQFIANVMASRPQNAFSERIPAEGGFLVPELLRAEVLSYMTPAIIRPRATVYPMTSERLPIPFLDNTSQNASAQALGGMTFALTEEGAPITSSTATFGRIVLEAWKVAGYFTAPNELVDDAPAFGQFLSKTIAEGLAWYEDDLFIGNTSNGVGRPQGLIYAPCAYVVTRNTSSEVLFADIIAMFKGLHPASKQAGLTTGQTSIAWLASASVLDQLLELYYNVGGSTAGTDITPTPPPDWLTMGDGDHISPSLLGLPLIVTDHQPAVGTEGDLMLADLRHYLIGDRMEMTVERSSRGGGFINDTSNFRVITRVDGRYWIQSSETTEAGQTVSPVVVLK